MNNTKIGWLWVAGQAVLLVALIALPDGDAWTLPGWLSAVVTAIYVGGLALAIIAALGLGRALTPTPVPTAAGELQTGGLYKFARHPLYTGVILVVVGIALRSQSWIHIILAIITVAFFDRKAAWEEEQLVKRYKKKYRIYAAKTPKFFPFTK